MSQQVATERRDGVGFAPAVPAIARGWRSCRRPATCSRNRARSSSLRCSRATGSCATLPAPTPEQVLTKQPADPAQSQSASTPAGAEHRQQDMQDVTGVIVVGGGFAGLEAVKRPRGAAVDVTLVDRNSYHLFLPLTYRVATGTLSPDEIAEPLRAVFRRQRRVRVVMAGGDGPGPRKTPGDPSTRGRRRGAPYRPIRHAHRRRRIQVLVSRTRRVA